MTSFKVEVQTVGNGDAWTGNSVRFATAPEAEEYGLDLAMRWTAVITHRVVPCHRPVNYVWGEDRLRPVQSLGLATVRESEP